MDCLKRPLPASQAAGRSWKELRLETRKGGSQHTTTAVISTQRKSNPHLGTTTLASSENKSLSRGALGKEVQGPPRASARRVAVLADPPPKKRSLTISLWRILIADACGLVGIRNQRKIRLGNIISVPPKHIGGNQQILGSAPRLNRAFAKQDAITMVAMLMYEVERALLRQAQRCGCTHCRPVKPRPVP